MIKIEDSSRYFYTCDGHVLKNYLDLINYFSSISDEAFNHHVSGENNDFANWVRDVLGKKEIADKLYEIDSKDEMLDFLKKAFKSGFKESEKRKNIIELIKGAFN